MGVKAISRIRSVWLCISRYIRRRPFFCAFILAFILFLYTPYIIIKRTYFTDHASTLPNDYPVKVSPEKQVEDHTCGVHAIHTVYNAYGLDPAKENVRDRLGVDYLTVFCIHDSTGALHPDIYMVLEQDGFKVNSIKLGEEQTHQDVVDHLLSGHMMILLIKRRENGHLHWVDAKNYKNDKITIYDSMKDEVQFETLDFFDSHVVTTLAVSPSGKLKDGIGASLCHLLVGSYEIKNYLFRDFSMDD